MRSYFLIVVFILGAISTLIARTILKYHMHIEDIYNKVKAPCKEIIWFEKSARKHNLEEPDNYQDKLINVALKNTKP